jgi:hypothetical protein
LRLHAPSLSAIYRFALLVVDIRYGLLPDKFLCPLLWAGCYFFPSILAVGAMAGYLGFALFTGDIGLSPA